MNRSDSTASAGPLADVTNIVIEIGDIPIPVPSASNPSTICRYSGSVKKMPSSGEQQEADDHPSLDGRSVRVSRSTSMWAVAPHTVSSSSSKKCRVRSVGPMPQTSDR